MTATGVRAARRQSRPGALTLLGLTLAAACGGGGGSPGPAPTPSSTASAPTPAATATAAQPTPGDVPVVAGMQLPGLRAVSVNRREWIVVDSTSERVPRPRHAQLVLPPDAGPEAGPLPVLACPDGAPADEGCAGGERQVPIAVADTDWVLGERQYQDPAGAWIVRGAAYGSAGENVLLVDPSTGDFATQLFIGPGPLFTGWVVVGPLTEARLVAALWRAPGPDYELLEAGDFPDGALPLASDASGRVAGNSNEPDSVPVVWIPDGDDLVLERLPLLPGARVGVAFDIDDGRIVGWSDDGERSRAVVWTAGDTGFALALLPPPPGAAHCENAVAISGARIAGSCRTANGAPIATVWTSDPGTAVWRVEAVLAPLIEAELASADDISGDLVVGSSAYVVGQTRRAVAWRLP